MVAHKKKLKESIIEMFIGPFGSALKNECFVSKDDGYCMVYEQKHAIKKTINLDNRYITKEKYDELKRFEVGPGDIIMSCRGTVGELFIIPENAPIGIIHPSLMKIRINSNYDKEYFLYLLQNYLKTRLNNGTSVKMAIKAKELENEMFQCPKIEDQKKVVNILNEIIEIIKIKEKQLLDLDNLIKSKYYNLFDSIKEKKCIGDVCEVKARIGWQGLTKKEYLSNGEYNLITGTDFTYNNKINFSKCVFVTKERYDQDINIQIKNGDILITKDGTIGKVAIVENMPRPTTLNSGVFVIRDKTNGKLLNSYIMYSFLSTRFEEFIELIKTGATIPHLNQGALLKYEIAFPKIELQKEFETFTKKINEIKNQILNQIEDLNKLYIIKTHDFFD